MPLSSHSSRGTRHCRAHSAPSPQWPLCHWGHRSGSGKPYKVLCHPGGFVFVVFSPLVVLPSLAFLFFFGNVVQVFLTCEEVRWWLCPFPGGPLPFWQCNQFIECDTFHSSLREAKYNKQKYVMTTNLIFRLVSLT